MSPEQVRAVLEEAGATRANLADAAVRGVHVDALCDAQHVRDAVQALRSREFLIEDLTAVDAAPQLAVLYHFHHLSGSCRVALHVLTDRETPAVPSIQDIFPGANWHEREAHDFFGVKFLDHPDLSPLILPEDAGDLRPLRKGDQRLKPLAELLPGFAPPPAAEPNDATPGPDSEGEA